MIKFLSPLLAGLLLTACQQTHHHAHLDKAQVTAEVHNMFDRFFADIKAEGFTAEFRYLDNSSDFFWAPPGYQSALDYDSVKVILEGNAPKFTSVQYTWDTVQVFPLTNILANYTGIVRSTLVDTAGDTSQYRLLESGTLIKRTDGWKYLSGQTAVLTDSPGANSP